MSEARVRKLEEQYPERPRCDHSGPVVIGWCAPHEEDEEPTNEPTHCPECGRQLVYRVQFDKKG